MNKKCMTKNGVSFTIRQPRLDEAQKVVDFATFIFSVVDDTTLTSNGEFNMTVEQEEDFLRKMNEESDNSIVLIAELDGEIASLMGFHGYSKRKAKHSGVFGISVLPKYHDQGIGRMMIETLLEWAREHPIVERVELSVSTNNPRGIHLYRSLGFEQEGYKKRSMRLDSGEYVDTIDMVLFV